MTETWLRTNRRAVAMGLVPADALLCAGLFMAVLSHDSYLVAAGVALALIGLCGSLAVVWLLMQPRLAYTDGELLVYVRTGPPYRVPIEIVEGFLLGQGPSFLPGKQHERTEASALVIRLAERAEDWSNRETRPALGKWCGSYITLRGTWSEPLNVDRVNQLNARLAEVQAQLAPSRPAD